MRRALALVLLLIATHVAYAAAQDAPAPFSMTTFVARAAATPGERLSLAVRLEVPPGLHIQSDQPRDPTLVPTTVTIEPTPGLSIRRVVFPQSRDLAVKGYEQPLAVFEDTVVIGLEAEIDHSVPIQSVITLPGRVKYQACNDTQCFFPRTVNVAWTVRIASAGERVVQQHTAIFKQLDFTRARPLTTSPPVVAPNPSAEPRADSATAPPSAEDVVAVFDRFEVVATNTDGYSDAATFVQFVRDAEAGVTRGGMFAGRGPLAILAIVFLGGLALNFTPCVLPMIPINLAIIGAGAHGAQRGRGLLLGLSYGAAMAAVYGVLGLVVILTARSFGSINASPWFNLALAALFIVLALAMFDVISIDLSRYSSGIRFAAESRGSIALALGMGGVAALLAGACVAPVVIQVVVLASELYASGTPAALALPFVLGLGMALPWPLAGAGIAALPRPGPWMVRVKQAMGVFILVTAAYYGYLAYEILQSRSVDPAEVRASVDEQLKDGWHASLVDGLAVAERSGTPVLIDFWATWCKNCLVMDRTTLRDPAVRTALATYTLIKYEAADIDASPARDLMRRIGAYGLPAYAILRPKR